MTIVTVLTIFRLVHLIGLIMGFGGALLADYTIFSRGVIRPVNNYTIFQTKFLSRIVTIGLCILWISGLALIIIKLQLQPDFLQNPKIWAKISVVIILTINGILVHKFILPLMINAIGRPLFGGVTSRQLVCMTLLGSVSLVSWALPFVLGKASGLNYVTPMSAILAVYLVCVLVTWLGLFAFMNCIRSIQELATSHTIDPKMPARSWDPKIASFNDRAGIGTRHEVDNVRSLSQVPI